MTATFLMLNAGSSSVKFQIFAQDENLTRLASGDVSGIGSAPVLTAARSTDANKTSEPLPATATQEDAVRAIINWVHDHDDGWQIAAVVHRIVHGGTKFNTPVRVTSDVFHQLKALIPLAPLHQPHNLAALGLAIRFLPHVPQIACFDTAFHAGHTDLFTHFALPQEWFEKGVRRYGFHGLSYSWIAHILQQEHPALANGRVVVAHLGNGASLCAMKNGVSIDTTMGMTALDGLPMGTRSGAIDAGAIINLIRQQGLGVDAVERLLYTQSGLKGLSGFSNDVKTLLESPDPRAKFAIDYFVIQIARYIAAMAVSIGGIDGLVFTGGIGEHAEPIRTAVLSHLSFLTIPQTLIIPANEERMMAMQARAIIKT